MWPTGVLFWISVAGIGQLPNILAMKNQNVTNHVTAVHNPKWWRRHWRMCRDVLMAA